MRIAGGRSPVAAAWRENGCLPKQAVRKAAPEL